MILGVDTGTATSGWARFDPQRKRFAGLGAIALKRSKGRAKTEDNADRIATIGGELQAAMAGCDRVVVERMSFPPGGAVPIALGFGCVVGLARGAVHRPQLYTVRPQIWQRAVLPGTGKTVDYKKLEQVVGEYVRRDRASAIALDSLEPKVREHAIDACAIALMGAYRIEQCTQVVSRIRPPPVVPTEDDRSAPMTERSGISDRTLAMLFARRLQQAGVFHLFLRKLGPKDLTYGSALYGEFDAPREMKVTNEDMESAIEMLLHDMDVARAIEGDTA